MSTPWTKGWVKWNDGDALPPEGEYVITAQCNYLQDFATFKQIAKATAEGWDWMYSSRIVAYLPERLPEPVLPEPDGCIHAGWTMFCHHCASARAALAMAGAK